MEKIKVKKTLLIQAILIVMVIIFNYISALIVNTLKIPIFLDTWGTSLGVLTGGFGVGAIGGILYNLLMASTVWGSQHWVWSINSLWIALATYFFLKHGFINFKNLKKLIFACVVISLTSGLVTFGINVFAFDGLSIYEPTADVDNFFFVATGNHLVAVFLDHMVVEFFDKTISLFIAAGIVLIIPYEFVKRKTP